MDVRIIIMTKQRILLSIMSIFFLFTINAYSKTVSNEVILEKISHVIETQKLIIEQMDKRFEQVDKRFEFIQYLLGVLLAAVIGMPFVTSRIERSKREDIDQFSKLLIVMKEMALNDEKMREHFKAGGLL